MKIIVGLGNPGVKYAASRHNLGFQVVDLLVSRHGVERAQQRFDAWLAPMRWQGKKVLLVKPLTYMNLSGRAVQRVMHWYKVDLKDLIVVYDDMDIQPGMIRIRAAGSAGGHKGMLSIISAMGSQDFPRVRIGIGRPEKDTVEWVLGTVAGHEKEDLDRALQRSADALECWIERGIVAAMNEYN